MVGDWFLSFDDEGRLTGAGDAAWLDAFGGGLPWRVHFAPIEDED